MFRTPDGRPCLHCGSTRHSTDSHDALVRSYDRYEPATLARESTPFIQTAIAIVSPHGAHELVRGRQAVYRRFELEGRTVHALFFEDPIELESSVK